MLWSRWPITQISTYTPWSVRAAEPATHRRYTAGWANCSSMVYQSSQEQALACTNSLGTGRKSKYLSSGETKYSCPVVAGNGGKKAAGPNVQLQNTTRILFWHTGAVKHLQSKRCFHASWIFNLPRKVIGRETRADIIQTYSCIGHYLSLKAPSQVTCCSSTPLLSPCEMWKPYKSPESKGGVKYQHMSLKFKRQI